MAVHGRSRNPSRTYRPCAEGRRLGWWKAPASRVNTPSPLLRLKYHNAIADAVADLSKPEEIGRAFSGFQKYRYQPGETLTNHARA